MTNLLKYMRQVIKKTFLFSCMCCLIATEKVYAVEWIECVKERASCILPVVDGLTKDVISDDADIPDFIAPLVDQLLAMDRPNDQQMTSDLEGEIALVRQEILVKKLQFERLLLISALGSLIAVGIVIWAIFLYQRNTRERIFYNKLEQQNEVLNQRAIGAESELAEKETLFDEAHHRLKNNLHFLLNLFEIQRSRLNSSAASQISDVLLDATNRVHAMAVIHQFSYGAGSGVSVSTSDLLNNLVQQTFDVGNGLVTINVDCRDVELDDEASKSVVLIVNELLCNAQKHAFDGKKTGNKIDVSLSQGVDYKNHLMVVDNGKGFSKELLNQTKRSMGLKLVRSMVKQLDGTLDVDSGSFGTRWTIDF